VFALLNVVDHCPSIIIVSQPPRVINLSSACAVPHLDPTQKFVQGTGQTEEINEIMARHLSRGLNAIGQAWLSAASSAGNWEFYCCHVDCFL
jgi:hypothetical protein